MVSNKQIIESLKKYNGELEEHLPKMNIKDFAIDDSDSSENDSHMISVIASSIVDLRTEMNLFRKNMLSDLHNILIKELSELNKKNAVSLRNVYSSLTYEAKNVFANYSEIITDEISKLKISINDVSNLNVQTNEKIEEFNDNFNSFKISVSDINSNIDKLGMDLKKTSAYVENKVNSFNSFNKSINDMKSCFEKFEMMLNDTSSRIDKRLDNIEHEMKEIKSRNVGVGMQSQNLSKNLINLNKKVAMLEKGTQKHLLQDLTGNKSKFEDVGEIKKNLGTNLSSIKVSKQYINVPELHFEKIAENVGGVQNEFQHEGFQVFVEKDRINNNIINIDEKLNRINSLR